MNSFVIETSLIVIALNVTAYVLLSLIFLISKVSFNLIEILNSYSKKPFCRSLIVASEISIVKSLFSWLSTISIPSSRVSDTI